MKEGKRERGEKKHTHAEIIFSQKFVDKRNACLMLEFCSVLCIGIGMFTQLTPAELKV